MSLSVSITKRYPGFTLDVAFEARDGERVALLGASGCGKSCTLRCIAGVEKPDAGRIVVNGEVFFDGERHIDLTPQQRKTALLFQSYQLFPHLTVLENVEAGMGASLSRGERREIARRHLAIFGMDGFADRFPLRLSGGQQQRVALARMIAARPALYMFDEPFSALDAYLKSALEQNMLDIFEEVPQTVLYVSHDIDEAYRLCQRIVVLHNGRIVEDDTPAHVMERPQTLATLRLTGCKNTSRARRVSQTSVEATDWGMTFDMGRDVPGDVAFLGVRASYIHLDDRPAPGRNTYDLRVARTSDARFERLVLLDPPRADAPARLQWKMGLVGADPRSLPRAGDVLRLHFDARHIHLVRS